MAPPAGYLPPPWFVPVEAPSCGAVLEVPAEATNDGQARRFVCDRISGHEHAATPTAGDPPADRHRQVTDNEAGRTFTWPADGGDLAARLARVTDAPGTGPA